MANAQIIGGQPNNFKELYHYTDKAYNEIPKGSFFTEFKTEKSMDAKRLTGSTNYLNYRVTVLVNRDFIYNFFSEGQTAYKPGLGMAIEYRNKKPISSIYLKVDKIY